MGTQLPAGLLFVAALGILGASCDSRSRSSAPTGTGGGAAGSAGTLGTGGETTGGASGSGPEQWGAPCPPPLADHFQYSCAWAEVSGEAFAGAGGQGGSECTIDLPPELGTLQPDDVDVLFDCTPLSPDPDDPQGWQISSSGSYSVVLLGDDACAEVQAGGVERLYVLIENCLPLQP